MRPREREAPAWRGGVVVNDEQHGSLVSTRPVHRTLPRAVVPSPGVLRHGSIAAIIAISTARSIYSGSFLMTILPWLLARCAGLGTRFVEVPTMSSDVPRSHGGTPWTWRASL